MTYPEFLKELNRASLNVRSFAELLHMNPNSISNYASCGEVPAHLALIVALIAELNRHGIAYEPVIHRVAPVNKKPRGKAVKGRFGGNPQEQLDFNQ